MELTPSQYKEIETLSAINYSVKQIAMYLDVDHKLFAREFYNMDSKVRYHYERGRLVAQAEIDKANLKRAKDGNLTSIQQWKKDSTYHKIDNLKKQTFYDEEKTDYENLQALIEKGQVKNLPDTLVCYYEQIDFIRCLYNKYESKSYIVNAVVKQWPMLSKINATNLYYETLNFFNLDNQVKVEAWANIYADKLDNMARICFELNDFETARRLTMDAAELRGVGKEKPPEVPDELLDRRPVFYTIRSEDIGIPREDRNKLAAFIDALEVTEREKTRLKREALIEDVPYEAVTDEPKDNK